MKRIKNKLNILKISKSGNKGFTLIELLAVIVVLGIILAIAIPKVTETIEISRKGSFESSVKSYIKAAQQYITKQEINGNSVTSGTIDDLEMSNKGEKWSGYWVSNDGIITFSYITNGDNYIANNATSNNVVSTKLTEPFITISNGSNDISISENTLSFTGGIYSSPKNIMIPSNVNTISSATFMYGQLTNVVMTNDINSIGSSAFANNNLQSVVIPSSVETIGGWAFHMNHLKNVIIPNSVETIGEYAFGSNELTSLVIPSSVETIGTEAFYGNLLTSIKNYAGNFNWKNILGANSCTDSNGNVVANSGTFRTGTCTIGTRDITITAE